MDRDRRRGCDRPRWPGPRNLARHVQVEDRLGQDRRGGRRTCARRGGPIGLTLVAAVARQGASMPVVLTYLVSLATHAARGRDPRRPPDILAGDVLSGLTAAGRPRRPSAPPVTVRRTSNLASAVHRLHPVLLHLYLAARPVVRQHEVSGSPRGTPSHSRTRPCTGSARSANVSGDGKGLGQRPTRPLHAEPSRSGRRAPNVA